MVNFLQDSSFIIHHLSLLILSTNQRHEVFLRVYKREDKKALQELFFDTVHHSNARDYTPEQLRAWAPVEPNREVWARLDSAYCFIVELDKQPVGFAALSRDGCIDFLCVHKDFQNRGVATALLKQLCRLARKNGLPLLKTTASITAKCFFERQGFVLVEEQTKTLNGIPFRQYHMEKRLPAAATSHWTASHPDNIAG